MTTAELVFDPFSEEYFTNPFEIYRRMRTEAPLYYSADQDFYALTRHADVSAALKDHEAFSSSRGCDLAMVQSDEPPQKSIIFMDPPDHRHMRSLLNKAFTPRGPYRPRRTPSSNRSTASWAGSPVTSSTSSRTSPRRSRSR